MNAHRYPDADIAAIYRVMRERRDMRHFTGAPMEDGQLGRLIDAALLAPSVGYMQPWRFVRVTNARLREALHCHVKEECARTAAAIPERAEEVRRLKLEGIRECTELLLVALPNAREQYVLGRRTLPEMDVASVACAIQNMWLAARAEGLGLGWVSIFDPEVVGEMFGLPAGSAPVALLCIGPVPEFYPEPMLKSAGWDSPRAREALVFENGWGQAGE